MSSPARLRSLRLVGFKSFAEKTELEFGPGISVVVGPNGSGKSNLADGLRWAMGEQGRSLRIRRAEDVIFAGSERRHGIGMADVTLVLDNGDGLLPVDFGEVSLGRRLYRSGENEYLLNRQRVRLRDIVELLEAANLADNAFLFIGQGMVDQALALRPEERRPLFEEVAGVRRHDRRRRLAEQQLAEAESNLSRVQDLLGELRPQARRLGQQVEQQRARSSAATELAEALVAAAAARWHAAASQAHVARETLAEARRMAGAELAGLGAVEDLVVELEARLVERRAAEDRLRASLETLRVEQTDLRLRLVRAEGVVSALQGERRRLESELTELESRAAESRQVLSLPLPEANLEAQAELRIAEQELAEALGELSRLRAAAQAAGEREAAVRRVEAARAADLDAAQRRAALAARRLAEQEAAHSVAVEAERSAAAGRATAAGALRQAVETETGAETASASARDALDAAEDHRRRVTERLAGAAADVASGRSRLEAIEEELRASAAGEIVAAAVRAGGLRVADGLEIAPALDGAVAAALGATLRAAALPALQAAALRGVRGVVVLQDAAPADSGRLHGALEAARVMGGGALVDAVRSDPAGVATRLLRGALWVPDLAAALSLQSKLPPGVVAATPDGNLVSAEGVVTIGTADPFLQRRAERELVAADLERHERALRAVETEGHAAQLALDAARRDAEAARAAAQQARAARRTAEEADRVAARAGDSAARDLAWAAAQLERMRADAARTAATVRSLAADQPSLWDAGSAGRRGGVRPSSSAAQEVADASATLSAAQDVADASATPSAANEAADTSATSQGSRQDAVGPAAAPREGGADPGGRALPAWEQRVREQRRRRDELAAVVEADERGRERAADARSRADAALALHDSRIAELGARLADSAGALEHGDAERANLTAQLSRLDEQEKALRLEVSAVQTASEGGRPTLEEAERDAALRRERLRGAEERVRSAEVAEIEARLARDALREQLLVELAALGPVGLAVLRGAGGVSAPSEVWRGAAGSESGDATEQGTSKTAAAEPASPAAPGLAGDYSARFFSVGDDDLAGALETALASATTRWEAQPFPEPPPSPGRLATLRRRVHELGAGNPFAVQELEEVSGRLEALERQRADLDQAILTTRKLIVDLSEQISRQFRATFEALEGAFERRFTNLFGGGYARLSLTEPEDLQSTGVDIIAQPPGKKRQPLAMLSGGERALTAVALLFAMLEVRPVPFCVLDEVDAALDEANVGRFAEALRELAKTTQIVVITHNRGTIENGDALYGVTLGADAVSRVVSLRLEEAASLAEHGSSATGAEAARLA